MFAECVKAAMGLWCITESGTGRILNVGSSILGLMGSCANSMRGRSIAFRGCWLSNIGRK